jgi:hypothetical protein
MTGEQSVELVNPLEEYNKALRRLRRYISSDKPPDMKVVLVCCALLYCFDTTRGEQKWALKHLDMALDILRRRQEVFHLVPGNGSCDDLNTIAEYFQSLDVQASIYSTSRTPSLLPITAAEKSGLADCVPPTFHSFAGAENALLKLQNWLMHFFLVNYRYKQVNLILLPAEIAQELRKLNAQLMRWREAFEVLKVKGILPPKEKSEILQNKASLIKVQSDAVTWQS